MIVTVTANPAVDRTYRLSAFTPGALHRAGVVHSEPSGKGLNVALVATRLGLPARAVVTAGGAEGRLLTDLLAGLGPAPVVEVVPVRGHTRINVTLLTPGAHEPTKINEPGDALSAAEADRLVAVSAAALVAGSGWLVYSGTLPPGTDPDLVTRLVAVARAAGVPTAVDASGAALVAGVSARAALLAPNRAELAELTGRPLETYADLLTAARQTRARTGGTVLVSLGAEGALLLTEEGGWYAAAPRITPVNPTGAGDALLAGYLAAGTADPPARLAYAVAVGASACLAEATADLPANLLDPAQVAVRPLAESDMYVNQGDHP